MTHLIAIVWTGVITYVAISYFERKFKLAHAINEDLRGQSE